jgi:Ras family protein T1
VFGSAASGKVWDFKIEYNTLQTTFLDGLIGKPFEEIYTPTVNSRAVVNAVYLNDQEKYLVLHEFESEKDIIQSSEKMDECDIVILLYDCHDPKSFAYVANIHKQLAVDPFTPVVYFATKSDLEPVQQVLSFCGIPS